VAAAIVGGSVGVTSNNCDRSTWLAPAKTARPMYAVNGERRSFALLRPFADNSAQERIRDLVLEAYAEYEAEAAVSEAAS